MQSQFGSVQFQFHRCAVCGYPWKRKAGKEPERCANLMCRSTRWKDGIDKRFNPQDSGVELVGRDRMSDAHKKIRADSGNIITPNW